MKANAWQKGNLIVLALVVMVVAVALVVPVVAGAVARGESDPVAIECQSGHACGGAPLALRCQSGTACGGRLIAVWPLPGGDAVCQSGHACGG